MKADKLKWSCFVENHSLASDSQVNAVESQLGIKFPEDFLQCAKKYHGCSPQVSDFDYEDHKLGKCGSVLGILCSFSPTGDAFILSVNGMLKPFLPEGLVAFAVEGGGGYICFQYNEVEQEPTVVIWFSGGGLTVSLARSFGEFIDLLHEPYPGHE